MKFVLALLLICVGGSVRGAAPLPVTTVAELDLQRYLGTWYEIARYDNWFQRKCDSGTMALYERNADGTIRVTNRCRTADGSWKEAVGVARKRSESGPDAQLEVRFAPGWLGWVPLVWGTYWVIDLAPDYSYAVVGEPSRKYLWILARAPKLDDGVLRAIRGRLEAMGYDSGKLLYTKG